MEWTDESILAFIKEYKDRPVLWDTNDEHYKLTSRKIEAWNRISAILDVSVAELKRKMNSLLASYRRERQKAVLEALKTGGSPDAYHSTWFAYKNFDFLKDKYQPKPPRNILEVSYRNRSGEDDARLNEEDAESFEYDMGVMQVGHDESSREQDREPGEDSEDTAAHYSHHRPSHLYRKRARSWWEEPGEHYLSPRRDEFDAYGEYIGAKLRQLDRRSASYVQKAISDILYEADMGSLVSSNSAHWDTTHIQLPHHSPTPINNKSPSDK